MATARFSDSRYYLNYTVTSGTQSIPNNNTLCTTWLQIIKDGGGSGYSSNTSYWYTGYPSSTSGTFTYNFGSYSMLNLYAGGQHYVAHNSDGTRSFDTSASVNADTPLGSAATGAFTVWLPTIPRATTPTVTGGSLTTGVASTINTTPASSGFTHDITYKFGTTTGTIATAAGASTSWTPPHTLLNQIPTTTSGTLTLTVVTKSGTTVIGTKTLDVVLNANADQLPTLSSVAWTDQNTNVNTNIGASIYVQGRSSLKAVVTASDTTGSTIISEGTTVNGVFYAEGTVIPITQSGVNTAFGTVTNGRGRVKTLAANFTAVAYEPPKLGPGSYSITRANSSYVMDPTGTYGYVNIDALATTLKSGATEKNKMTIVISTKQRGTSSWVLRKTVNGALAFNGKINLDGATGGNIFAGDKSYDVRIEIYDQTETYPPVGNDKTSIHIEEYLPTTKVALDIYGSRLGVGKMVEDGTLDVLGDTYTSGNFYAGSLKKKVLLTEGVAGTDITSGTIPNARIPQATTALRGGALLATQAEVDAGTDTSKYVSSKTLADKPRTPFALASGLVWSNSGYATVVYPVGRFTVTPILTTTVQSTSNNNVGLAWFGGGSQTASSFTVIIFSIGGIVLTGNVAWQAIQMTPTTASG